jgi:hypothetical protein
MVKIGPSKLVKICFPSYEFHHLGMFGAIDKQLPTLQQHPEAVGRIPFPALERFKRRLVCLGTCACARFFFLVARFFFLVGCMESGLFRPNGSSKDTTCKLLLSKL